MSIAVEKKRILTAENLSGRILLAFANNSKPETLFSPSGGNS
jgi:hypothetical protein